MSKRKADDSGSDHAPSNKSDVEEEFELGCSRGTARPKSILLLATVEDEAPRYYLRDVKHAPKMMRKVLFDRLKEMDAEPEDAKTLTSEYTDIVLDEDDSLIDSGLVPEDDDEETQQELVDDVREFLEESKNEDYVPKTLANAKICWVISMA